MKFTETRLKGAYIIEIEPTEDERGFFARSWCKRDFESRGLNSEMVQSSISFNKKRGTLRGMHYQASPNEEAKIVRCTMGAIFDVIIDLRPQSATFKQWVAAELKAENRKMLYVPEGCAHGFLTLMDNTEVLYQMSTFYEPASVRGVRWDDPAFGIRWPLAVQIISARDEQYARFVASGSGIFP